MAVTYYVQSGATSNNCGGTDADDSLARSGTDGVSNSTTTFVSATAAFTAGDVGRGIWINTTTPRWRIIASVTNSTTVVLNSALTSTQSGLSWKIGGSWLTIAQLLGANGFVSGDTGYVAPGTYREVVTVGMTSAVATTSVIADVANSRGFKTAAGVTVSAGDVVWTAYTTNDTTTPSTSPTLNLNGTDFLSFSNFVFVGGNIDSAGSCIRASVTNSVSITITDCAFIGSRGANTGILIQYVGVADVASNWVIDRCTFFGAGARPIDISFPTSTVADYDSNFLIRNCTIWWGGVNGAILIQGGGANAFKGGGLTVLNCTIIGEVGIQPNVTTIFGTFKCVVSNCVIYSSRTCLNAAAAAQITEDYNFLFGATARANTTSGTHSQVSPTYAPLLEIGQSVAAGRLLRPFLMPTAGSPMLGFGGASPPTVDFMNRPRPAGGASASTSIGAFERHDTGIAGGTANADAGNCLQLGPGPADQDIPIPVNAVSTTISIKQKTASYGGTNYPQIELLANGEIGVSGQTVTDSAANTSYTTLTLASFTPTRAGWVTLRLKNRTNDGAGIVYWDTASMPPVNLCDFNNYNRTEVFPGLDSCSSIMAPIVAHGGLLME